MALLWVAISRAKQKEGHKGKPGLDTSGRLTVPSNIAGESRGRSPSSRRRQLGVLQIFGSRSGGLLALKNRLPFLRSEVVQKYVRCPLFMNRCSRSTACGMQAKKQDQDTQEKTMSNTIALLQSNNALLADRNGKLENSLWHLCKQVKDFSRVRCRLGEGSRRRRD